MMDDLGPCPFCRQEFAAPGQEGTGHFVICGACGARGPRRTNPIEAAEHWNAWRITGGGKSEPAPVYDASKHNSE